MTTGYKSIYTGTQVDAAVARVQGLDTELATKVDKTTTINGEPLSGNITLNAAEVGAMPDTTKYARTITCSNGVIELKDQDGNSFSPAATATITGVTVPWENITGNISDNTALQTALDALQTNIDGKQATLVSGSNIKTINSTSLLGSGNINVDSLPSQTGQSGKFLTTDGTSASWATIQGGGTWGSITGTLSDQTDLQTALNGKQATLVSGTNIKTINSNSLLGSGNIDIDSLPSQTGQSGKFLTTDGTDASWATIQGGGTWGSITGTLSDQVDLQDALNAKQDKLTAGENITIAEQGGEWTPAVQDSNLGENSWRAIVYDGTKFVALGEGGYYSTSTDGTTWTSAVQDSNLQGQEWSTMAYGDNKFVAITYGGSIGYYYSTSADGTAWTAPVEVPSLSNDESWVALAYDGSKFVALCTNNRVSTSVDGTTWSSPIDISTALGSHYYNTLAYGNNKFVTISRDGYISTSADGTTWTPAVQDSNINIYLDGGYSWVALTYDGTKFVAIGSGGYYSTSTDGTTWTPATKDSNLSNHGWVSSVYDGSKLIALDTDGYISQYLTGDDLVISAAGGTWGSITGTLSDQVDLQDALNAKQATITGGATTITSSNLTSNRALISSSSGKVAVSSVTNTELGYLSGTTSSVQEQLNSKVSSTTIKNIVSLTQAEYDALTIKDTNTVYIIIPSA